MIQFTLFGYPQISINKNPVSTFASNKVQAILYYLILTRRPVSRDKLLGLLWGDAPEKKAKASLRSALYNIQQVLPSLLTTTRKEVEISSEANIQVDVWQLGDAMQGDELSKHVALYTSDLLDGFYVNDAPGFEEWVLQEREHWRTKVVALLVPLIEQCLRNDRSPKAVQHCKQLLSIEPWREPIHRKLMLLLARQGNHIEALQHFEEYRVNLKDEFDLPPSPEISGLQLRIRRLQSQPRSKLVDNIIPLIGRASELEQISLLLNQNRLVTITGPGGMGKTHLAQALGHKQKIFFLEGVYFVSVMGLTNTASLTQKLVEALPIAVGNGSDPESELLYYLADRELLLILDNFEQLVGNTSLVIRILQQAPYLKILVTSREQLDLREESAFSLHGLTLPQSRDLFRQAATRISPNWATYCNYDTQQEAAIDQIGKALGGLPLGLHLAAAQVMARSCQEIADLLVASMEHVSVTWQDIPERHRSLHAAFDSSWQLLTKHEQRTLSQSSLFQGGFIASVSHAISDHRGNENGHHGLLAGLVKKSMLTHKGKRFDLHPFIRAFAQTQLTSREVKRVEQDLAAYYLTKLSKEWLDLRYRNPQTVSEWWDVEWQNLRLAWHFSMVHQEWSLLEQASAPLISLCKLQNRRFECREMLAKAINAMEMVDLSESTWVARLQVQSIYFELEQGMAANAHEMLLRCQPALHKSERALDRGWLFEAKANCYRFAGDLHQAIACFQTAREQYHDAGGYPDLEGSMLLGIGNVHFQLNEVSKARQFWQKGYDLFRNLGAAYQTAGMLVSLARADYDEGEYLMAKQRFQNGLDIIAGINSFHIATACHDGLGLIAKKQGDFETAKIHFGHNLLDALAQNNNGNQFTAHVNLANVALDEQDACEVVSQLAQLEPLLQAGPQYESRYLGIWVQLSLFQGKLDKAETWVTKFLRIALQEKHTSNGIEGLLWLAEVWFEAGEVERGSEAIRIAMSSPTLDISQKQQGIALRKRYSREENENSRLQPTVDFWLAVNQILAKLDFQPE